MTQYEAVEEAMMNLGGYATLAQLYANAIKVSGSSWGTKTPYASIRRIVQLHPSRFFRIRPGLWGLAAQREQILLDLGLSPTVTAASEHFTHTLYQGFLVEIGNARGLHTHVPRQDKNRKFLGQPLAMLASSTDLPSFTYDRLITRASTIDVTWVNARGFPDSFFEVEHSTDFQNSLLKFVDFTDFAMKFVVVADRVRKAEFDAKVALTAFSGIKNRVMFQDFEAVAKHYEYAKTGLEGAR